MIDAVKQRLKSKTYLIAVIGAVVTAIEANSGLISTLIPAEYRAWTIMLWPALMITLREVTTSAISEK